MSTQCAGRALHILVVLIMFVAGSAKNNISVVSCYVHENVYSEQLLDTCVV
jgi:hypothetical protein